MVITLSKPNNHAHNVGKTILNVIGLQDWVTNTEEEYINKAVELAQDIPKLLYFRKEIRNMMLKSKLCDGELFTRNVESIYSSLYQKHNKLTL